MKIRQILFKLGWYNPKTILQKAELMQHYLKSPPIISSGFYTYSNNIKDAIDVISGVCSKDITSERILTNDFYVNRGVNVMFKDWYTIDGRLVDDDGVLFNQWLKYVIKLLRLKGSHNDPSGGILSANLRRITPIIDECSFIIERIYNHMEED